MLKTHLNERLFYLYEHGADFTLSLYAKPKFPWEQIMKPAIILHFYEVPTMPKDDILKMTHGRRTYNKRRIHGKLASTSRA